MTTDLSFGQWLKRRRRGAGLTQEELAERVGYAVATLRKIERDELRPAYQMAERLAEELGIDPSDRRAFIQFARDEAADPPALPTQTTQLTSTTSSSPAPPLPRPLTSLVGREAEVAAVEQLLGREDVCLVTLVGPGGTGKTRLALEVARAVVEREATREESALAPRSTLHASHSALHSPFPDGVYFVNLVPIRDPHLVPSTIAQALGVKEQGGQPLLASLTAWLRGRRVLLLLDNFEQVISAAPVVAALLAAGPGVKALVTSRETLHISGEHEYFVPPLAVPPTGAGKGNGEYALRLTEYEAVRLFLQRAQAVRRDFEVTEANARAVAEICHRLDGLPLAIELAAARVKLLPPDTLLARLDSRLKLLTGGPRDLPARQQTLRGAIDWSYDLLSEAEKVLFRRLAVFPGRRSLDAVAVVCATDEGQEAAPTSIPSPSVLDPPSVLDGLASLMDKSLLRQVVGPDGEPRFVMLETIREYALERLRESGEEEGVRRALADYYRRFTDEAQRHFFGPHLSLWLDRVEADLNNLRAVLAWSQTAGSEEAQRVAVGLEIAGLLWRFWALRGRLTEGRAWLDALLARGQSLPASARYYALHTVGNLAADQGDYRRAKELYEECLVASQTLGQALIVAHMHNNLGNIALVHGDFAAAERLYEAAVADYRALGQTWGMGMALSNLGELARLRGDAPRARSILGESLRIVQQTKDEQRRAETLYTLGLVAHDQADLDEATRRLEEALALYQAGANSLGIALTLDALARVAGWRGDYGRAGEMRQQALAWLRDLGDQRGQAYTLYGLGRVAQAQGEAEKAAAAYRDGLSRLRALGDRGGMVMGLEGLALLAVARGEYERAARLFGVAAAQRDTLGFPAPPVDRPPYQAGVASARTAVGEAAFIRLWEQGQAMTLEQAVDAILEAGSSGDAFDLPSHMA